MSLCQPPLFDNVYVCKLIEINWRSIEISFFIHSSGFEEYIKEFSARANHSNLFLSLSLKSYLRQSNLITINAYNNRNEFRWLRVHAENLLFIFCEIQNEKIIKSNYIFQFFFSSSLLCASVRVQGSKFEKA